MFPAIDLERYPLHRPDSPACTALVARCKADLAQDGMFNLEGFMLPDAIAETVAFAAPRLNAEHAFTHARRHNIYFRPVPELPAGHPALAEVETRNFTLCADQCAGTPVDAIYSWRPLADFLARTMDHQALYPMPDPLARFNVMGYPDGWGLNWHFDRSQFTTTLLLQAPLAGGDFVYRSDLRTQDDPNYDGVAALLRGKDEKVRSFKAEAGTLNVFKGRNTAHRVTPVEGEVPRIIAVFTYYDRPGVTFTREERIGFYGRAE
ncbi:2OG-Fe(II) oxygenase [Roseobacter sp. YSTF-M11]|uniref:2OG-Fe(II) oxygenase n=1 Tax=Roseobacter insulae TaxID=2859783 RepID=A0A9X1K4K5_9RHOB|nr:2OG-Fe(II) oxygenase [Roseobacter insulae]MBW4710698.1 2OG-Fe(II) oxygenase [Roseobacter insulae]